MQHDTSHEQTTSDIPKNPAVRRVWVCGQLRLRGTSLRALALKEGVTPQAMSAALAAPNKHLEPVIAGALGLTPERLFPERFDAVGNRVVQTRLPQRSTRPVRAKVENTRRV